MKRDKCHVYQEEKSKTYFKLHYSIVQYRVDTSSLEYSYDRQMSNDDIVGLSRTS